MKKYVVLLIIFFSAISYGQGVGQMGWVAKFGLAAGITPIWIVPDFSALNSVNRNFGVSELPESGMFVMGGGGYAYLMVIDNVRIGGMGFGGSIHRSSLVNGLNKELDYSIGGGAFTIEYTFPFIKKIAVSVGAMIGGGKAEIDIYQNKGFFDWQNLWGEISNSSKTTKNINRRLTNKFFTITPTLNVDIPLNRFIAFRIGGGYLLPFNNTWKVDNDKELINTPGNLRSNSFFIQTGLFIGFFAF